MFFSGYIQNLESSKKKWQVKKKNCSAFVCVFSKLHIIAQSGPVILVII